MTTADPAADSTGDPANLATLATGFGVAAAFGSVLVALGLTDVLAYARGYRPGGWVVALYARAFLVTVAGWSLLAYAAVRAGRAVLRAER